MTAARLVDSQINAGVWSGAIAGAGDTEPALTISYQGTALEGVSLTHDSDRNLWIVSVDIPRAAINDGVQSFLISHADGTTLGSFALMGGAVMAEDLRAEIALLRAELDMLKQSFRQHCADS